MVLGKHPVPGRPTYLDYSRAYCACSRCGWGLLGHFYSHLSFLSWGWSGGAMVLGKLPVPGRPTIWTTVGQGPTDVRVGVVWTFFLSSVISLFFLPLSGRRPD